MKLKSLISLFSLILLIGCAIKRPYELYQNQFIRHSNEGILLCSIIHARYGLIRPTPSYYIRRIGQNERIRIYGYNSLSQAMFAISGEVDDGGPGVVKILQLPEGNYEIFKWDLFYNLGMSQWHESPKQEFSVPFEVQADSINYINQLTLDNYQLSFKDQSERDLAEAYKRNSSLKGLQINKQYLRCISGCEGDIEESDQFIYTPPPVPVK